MFAPSPPDPLPPPPTYTVTPHSLQGEYANGAVGGCWRRYLRVSIHVWPPLPPSHSPHFGNWHIMQQRLTLALIECSESSENITF